MIAGMGWLLGLCPPPETLVLAELCKPFGILPTQVKTQDDWEFLAEHASLRRLEANYQAWDRMVAYDPEVEGTGPRTSIDQDLIQYMLELMQQAKETYG